MKHHIMLHHPDVSLTKYARLWELTESEKTGMQVIWSKRNDRKAAKKQKSTLVISAAHSSRRALASV